jgi:hypothetical protein
MARGRRILRAIESARPFGLNTKFRSSLYAFLVPAMRYYTVSG